MAEGDTINKFKILRVDRFPEEITNVCQPQRGTLGVNLHTLRGAPAPLRV